MSAFRSQRTCRLVCSLFRAAVAVKLSVHRGSGRNFHYAEDDRYILTNIGFRPDRASSEDNRAKYTPE
ncbi:TPA: phage polarity suppression protein [Providencia rettgeri]